MLEYGVAYEFKTMLNLSSHFIYLKFYRMNKDLKIK